MTGFALLAAALVLAGDPVVHVMIHIPLAHAPLAIYHRELARAGRVTDHVGTGTWTASGDPRAPIVVEAVDHLEITTTLATARRFLPAFLHRMRSAQRQQETLGEIFGGAYGTAAQTRTRITVRLQSAHAQPSRLLRVHRIFANNGDGGDSDYPERGTVIVYSGVRARDAAHIEAALTRAGFAFTTAPETFITDDGPTR